MANYAAILSELTISGSRKSDGTANAGGKVYAYRPGTLTTVSLYSDAAATTIATQPITLDSGGRVPRSTYPDGLFITQPVRLLIQDSATSATTVSDSVYVPSTAGAVGVDNDGFTDSTLDDILTDAYTSVGGTDWKYLESAGATARTIKAKFSELWISVKDFGAVGDGVAIDTTAIQAAMNRVKALGGGVCYFPPGTYKIDQALSLTSATGVTLLGVRGATTINSTNATANVFTFATAATSCAVEGIIFIHTATTTGAAISVAAGQEFAVRDVSVTPGDFTIGFDVSGASSWFVQNSFLSGIDRGIRSNISATSYPSIMLNSQAFSSAGSAVELNGAGGNYTFIGGLLWGANGLLQGGSFTGGPVNLFGTVNNATTAYNMGGSNIGMRWWGTNVDGYTTSQASGGGVGSAFTPDWFKGRELYVRLTSGGAAVLTINAPSPVPSAGAAMRDVRIRFFITAAAGGAITARFNAVYIIVGGGTDIVIADGSTQIVEFAWDVVTTEWRECFRSVTLT